MSVHEISLLFIGIFFISLVIILSLLNITYSQYRTVQKLTSHQFILMLFFCCFQSDVYSLGVILFEMFHTFQTEMEKFHCMDKLRKDKELDQEFLQSWPLHVSFFLI